jgi:hypothetical protein
MGLNVEAYDTIEQLLVERGSPDTLETRLGGVSVARETDLAILVRSGPTEVAADTHSAVAEVSLKVASDCLSIAPLPTHEALIIQSLLTVQAGADIPGVVAGIYSLRNTVKIDTELVRSLDDYTNNQASYLGAAVAYMQSYRRMADIQANGQDEILKISGSSLQTLAPPIRLQQPTCPPIEQSMSYPETDVDRAHMASMHQYMVRSALGDDRLSAASRLLLIREDEAMAVEAFPAVVGWIADNYLRRT